jgi:hypothetical protein
MSCCLAVAAVWQPSARKELRFNVILAEYVSIKLMPHYQA